MLPKLIRKVFGFADFTEFLFEQNYHDPNRCAKCGSEDLYLEILVEQWIKGRLTARKIIPFCKDCAVVELL